MGRSTGAHWTRSRYSFRVIHVDGEPGPWIHAPTLADIREAITGLGLAAEIRRIDREGDYQPYRRMEPRP